MRFGLAAERFAEEYLVAAGLEVLARRYRTRGGELDLVARDGGTIVFVEVKARRQLRWGGGAEAVDRHKQARLRAAAAAYLRHLPPGRRATRFDVIEVWSRRGRLRVRWLTDAFRG